MHACIQNAQVAKRITWMNQTLAACLQIDVQGFKKLE